MSAEMGEYLVGAYLKEVEKCEIVTYNERIPGGKLAGLSELDVIGLNYAKKTAYLCEVTTHLRSARGNRNKSFPERIADKHKAQTEFAKLLQGAFKEIKYMLWTPRISSRLASEIKNIEGLEKLEVIANKDFIEAIKRLIGEARINGHPTNNPAFRLLQILHFKPNRTRNSSSQQISSTNRPTLNNAMIQVLKSEPNRQAHYSVVADKINQSRLYFMKDGRPVDKQQIMARVINYPKVFRGLGHGIITLV